MSPASPPSRPIVAAVVSALVVGSPSLPGSGTLRAQDVTWSPGRPVEGSLFTVRVHPSGPEVRPESGRFAGEPLHFHPSGDGYVALAAAPLGSAGDGTLRIELRGAAGEIRVVESRVPVERGAYRMEELEVAPKYGEEPDSVVAARLADERRRARAVSAGSHSTPRLWDPPFVRPRPGRVTSGFGNGRTFNGRVRSRHMGTDLAGDPGDPVRSVARGVVALVDEFYLGGNVVYVDHGAGLVSVYLHLSEQTVAPGDTVAAGHVVGRVGATGRVTGPHLHWIVRYGGITVDPTSLLAVPGDDGEGARERTPGTGPDVRRGPS